MSRREWVDGVALVWMTTSQLGKRSQLGLGFGVALTGLGFLKKKLGIGVDKIYLHELYPFL